jgi:hypothetical protein
MAGCAGSIILFAEKLAVGGLFSFLPCMEKTILMECLNESGGESFNWLANSGIWCFFLAGCAILWAFFLQFWV